MQRILIMGLSLLCSCCALANSLYQIDLIVFAQHAAPKITDNGPLIPTNTNAIPLKPNANKTIQPYSLLPNSYSDLKDHYYLLSRKSSHPVLGHYSWRQSTKNQSAVALALSEYKGWQIQGTLHISQGNYYTFDAELQVSPPNNPQSSFSISQKQRLKDGLVYYLDDEQIGMVVKIHQIA